MDWAVLGLASEQVTFALLIALGLFFLYLQLLRFARLGSQRRPEPPDKSEDKTEETDEPDQADPPR